jgi:sarcosine oxidase subunit alpha
MTQPFRIASGGRIDRSRLLAFRFAGRTYQGYAGDTLASALLANGVRLIGRSFKYHRPRGLMGVGVEEANALVQLGTGARSTPNVRATEVLLYDGLVAEPVNCWPSLQFDVGAVNSRLARFLPAGFYYKTFMWPSWHLYEGLIRRAAGLGRVASEPDPDRYEHRYAHCDVLVVGGGPAGLAAARAAAAGGARVMLTEQEAEFGGSLLVDGATIDTLDGPAWALKTVNEIAAASEAICLTRTTAVGYFDHNLVLLAETMEEEAACTRTSATPRVRLWKVRAGRVILATGAIERPLVFPGNDRPGVMLAEAVRGYIARFAVRPAKRAVIFTNNDDAYRTAFALADSGASVAALIDLRTKVPSDLAESLTLRGIAHHLGGAVIDTRGGKALRSVRLRCSDGTRSWIDCDLLAMSGGRNPSTHLFSQSGGTLRYDEALACFVPDYSVQTERSVGASRGQFGLTAALIDGHEAGLQAAAASGWPSAVPAPHASADRACAPVEPAWRVEGGRSKAFVDFQNDVTADDIVLSARENFRSIEHLKRYTTLGMAPDQGKTSNVNALAIMASLTGKGIGETGTTRFRFPFAPIPISSMAGIRRGELFRPLRQMPAHDRHVAAGAVFEDFGGWQRPACYPRPGESHRDAEQREARTVREAAGLFEASPLGKIEIVGPDAARFLDLIYCNAMSSLKVGRVRYGLMLNELGVVIDDGVCARLSEQHFLICTSSGGAGRITEWLEEWRQCEWPDLDLVIAPVTSAWGVLTLSGPDARDILVRVGTDIDLTPAAFPHMSFRQGTVGGLRARILRVSYTGDLSYEINVPARSTPALWDRIMAGGANRGAAYREGISAHRHRQRRHDGSPGHRLWPRTTPQGRFHRQALAAAS